MDATTFNKGLKQYKQDNIQYLLSFFWSEFDFPNIYYVMCVSCMGVWADCVVAGAFGAATAWGWRPTGDGGVTWRRRRDVGRPAGVWCLTSGVDAVRRPVVRDAPSAWCSAPRESGWRLRLYVGRWLVSVDVWSYVGDLLMSRNALNRQALMSTSFCEFNWCIFTG